MKRLVLLRHAKSAWDQPGLADPERPLNARGRAAAAVMAAHVERHLPSPAAILCSTASRTRQTLAEMELALGRPLPPACYDRRLYMAEPDALLAIIRNLDDALPTVMLVGHNPGLQHLAAWLAGGGPASGKFPTAALAVFDLAASRWRDIAPGGADLAARILPKDLPQG